MDKIKRIRLECPFSLEIIDLEFKIGWDTTPSQYFLVSNLMLGHTT
jgi:hypothetical protein